MAGAKLRIGVGVRGRERGLIDPVIPGGIGCCVVLAVGGGFYGHIAGPMVHVMPVILDGFRAVRACRSERWHGETHEQPRCRYKNCAPTGFGVPWQSPP